MKQLFKVDTKGRLRVWQIRAKNGTIVEESGLVDGGLASHIKQCHPKNIGKANETTAIEQSVIEAKAKYKKKLDKDYFKTQEEALNTEVLLPMLAETYEKAKKHIEFPCHIQPKLDGQRCLADATLLRTRQNKPIDTMGHIAKHIPKDLSGKLDGELYAHGLTFQENMKLIKKLRPESVNVVYHVYDFAIENTPFPTRYGILQQVVKEIDNPCIELVPTYEVNNMEEVREYHAKFLQEGYEGSILRWGNAPYKFNGRSKNLVKFKDFLDIALPIKDIVPMEAKPTHGLVVCEMNGQEFKATPKMSHEEREELLTNKADYIGKTAEIRYFETTDGGLLRFPVFVGIRNDK